MKRKCVLKGCSTRQFQAVLSCGLSSLEDEREAVNFMRQVPHMVDVVA